MMDKPELLKLTFNLVSTLKDHGLPLDVMTDFNIVVKPVVKKFVGLKAIVRF